MNNAFLKMATNDADLIQYMKKTIEYQNNVLKKRNKLVTAITHNVKYLAHLHQRNASQQRD